MNNNASITALMSSFGRAFHTENEVHPVFVDPLAKELMTAEEYEAVQRHILNGARFLNRSLTQAGLPTKKSSGCSSTNTLRPPHCAVLRIQKAC